MAAMNSSRWPAVTPWLVSLVGLLLGRWIGYSPHLLVATALACLVIGSLRAA